MKLYEFTKWPDLSPELIEVEIHDEPMLERGFAEIKPDWTVLDVGASIGYYSVLAGQKAHQGVVLAIEPHPEIAEVLEKNLRLNNASRVRVIRKALTGDTAVKSVPMQETDGRGGTEIPYAKEPWRSRIAKALKDGSWARKIASRMRRQVRPARATRRFSVEACTLDELVLQTGLQRIDLIKMDIQGAEYDALRGGIKALRDMRPILLVELHNRPQWTPEQLRDLLEAEGYRTTRESAGHADFLRAEPRRGPVPHR